MSVKTTTCGLIKWTEKMFEKLGWMVLALNEAKTNPELQTKMVRKLVSYEDGLSVLEKSIELKMKGMKDDDKKDDLQVELERVRNLRKFFEEKIRPDIPTVQTGGKKMSAKKSSNKGRK
jgi:hypothetical protein